MPELQNKAELSVSGIRGPFAQLVQSYPATYKVLYLIALNKNGVISVTSPLPKLHPKTLTAPPRARMKRGNISVGYNQGTQSQPIPPKAAV